MGKRKFRLKYIKNYKREKYVGKKLVVSIPLSSLPSSMSSSFVSSQSMIVQIPIYNYTLLPVHSAAQLHLRLTRSRSIPDEWASSLLVSECHSSVFPLSSNLTCSSSSVTITVIIRKDLTWLLFLNDRCVHLHSCKLLQPFRASQLNSVELILKVLSLLQGCKICIGNPDEKFIAIQQRRNGTFSSNKSGNIIVNNCICIKILFCIIGTDIVAYFDASLTTPTIRHTDCEMLLSYLGRCCFCDDYR